MFKYEHLLVLPVPFRRKDDVLLVESQARHGLERWLDHFETLVLAAPLIPESIACGMKEAVWVTPDNVSSRVKFVPLPWAYRPDCFIYHLPSTLRVLSQLIDDTRYLQFGIGSFWGDWAAIGAELAIRKQRKFAVHTDRVEHEVILRTLDNEGIGKRFRTLIDAFLMKNWHKRIIKQCHLGLFHGMDTFEAYRPWLGALGRGYVIHDIHDEGMSGEDQSKLLPTEPKKEATFKLFYAGRMAPEKAPQDWIKVMQRLHELGVSFEAQWVGDGPLRESFIRELVEADLGGIVDAPGFVSDRGQIEKLFNQADIFVFTHITPESPRCLLESLRFGIPIVGYDSAYARDLIKGHGGGILVPCGDWETLAQTLASLFRNAADVALLKHNAHRDGIRFTSRAVFLERANLIKTHLSE